MQQTPTSHNGQRMANEQVGQTTPKPYHTPSFTRLGKVEQLTGQATTRGATTRGTTRATTAVDKNGRAS